MGRQTSFERLRALRARRAAPTLLRPEFQTAKVEKPPDLKDPAEEPTEPTVAQLLPEAAKTPGQLVSPNSTPNPIPDPKPSP